MSQQCARRLCAYSSYRRTARDDAVRNGGRRHARRAQRPRGRGGGTCAMRNVTARCTRCSGKSATVMKARSGAPKCAQQRDALVKWRAWQCMYECLVQHATYRQEQNAQRVRSEMQQVTRSMSSIAGKDSRKECVQQYARWQAVLRRAALLRECANDEAACRRERAARCAVHEEDACMRHDRCVAAQKDEIVVMTRLPARARTASYAICTRAMVRRCVYRAHTIYRAALMLCLLMPRSAMRLMRLIF